jgi:hypothetical protein
MMRTVTSLALAVVVAFGFLSRPAGADVVTTSTHALQLRDDVVPLINLKTRKVSVTVRSTHDAGGHRVALPALGTAGDPTLHGAQLVVYDANGSGEEVVVDLPASGWHHEGNDFPPDDLGRYLFSGLSGGALGPISKIWIKQDKITIEGGKSAWTYSLDEPFQGAVAVRLTLGTWDTWCAVGTPRDPAASFDRPGRFVAAVNTPPPATCPPR